MKSTHHREWTDRFSDYLAGALDEPARADVDRHLAECGPCREILAGLRGVVARAEEAGDVEPPRDLWPGIEEALADARASIERARREDVIALPTPQGRRARTGRRLTPARLAAAAVVLVAVTAGTTWHLASRAPASGGDAVGMTAPGSDATRMVTADAVPPGLADQVAALEEALDSARETMDPNTVLVLERNLTAIERAIADSKQALALDPGNAFLAEHLERMYERKLVYLQDVARVVEWAG